MEIVVCVKPVPDAESRLRPRADGIRLDEDGMKFVLAGYDESAVEQALLLKEAGAARRVHVVSVGPAPRTGEVLRAALALGCDTATWVETPPDLAPDGVGIARLLAQALGRLPHDLVLVGKQAGDDEGGVVGPALGEFLGVANFSGVVDLRWEAERSTFRFRGAVEGGAWRLEAPPPLVVALQQAWNDPRTARLPNILKSRRASIERVSAADAVTALGDRATRRARPSAFRLPPPRTGARMIEFATPEEAAEKLLKLLRDDAKVWP